jgi:hypothetical protein
MLSCSKDTFPAQGKVAQVILILKPGKLPNELTSYRPISLLLIVSKVSEKLLIMVDNNGYIPRQREALHSRTNTSNCTKDK